MVHAASPQLLDHDPFLLRGAVVGQRLALLHLEDVEGRVVGHLGGVLVGIVVLEERSMRSAAVFASTVGDLGFFAVLVLASASFGGLFRL